MASEIPERRRDASPLVFAIRAILSYIRISSVVTELSGETWVASAFIEEFTADLLPAGSNVDLITESRQDDTLATVRGWIQSKSTPAWADCAGLSPELRCWRLQVGNLSIDTGGRLWRRRAPPAEGSQLVVPRNERRAMIRRFHDSLFAGHLGISRTVFRLQTRVYWPGLRNDVRTYVASCTVCIARKSPCPRRAPMGHVAVGRRWERVAMDLYVNHVGEGKSLCAGYGGLLLSMDGGLSAVGKNSGRFLQ